MRLNGFGVSVNKQVLHNRQKTVMYTAKRITSLHFRLRYWSTPVPPCIHRNTAAMN